MTLHGNTNGQFDRIMTALHSHEDQEHQQAYTELLSLGGEVVPALVEAFPETNGRARLSVIKALGELGDPRAVELLVTLMRNRDMQEYIFVSSLAAKALGQIGQQEGPVSEQAVAGLLETLQDENAGIRRMAALVLGNIGDPDSVPALTAALGDPDKQVRALAARALGFIKADRAVSALTVRLADHDSLGKPLTFAEEKIKTVSEAAAWALRRIDSPDAKQALRSWKGRRQ